MRWPTGSQEIAGSILGSRHLLSKRFGHEIISMAILSRRAVVSNCWWRKYGHLVLVNRLGSVPRNIVDRLTDCA